MGNTDGSELHVFLLFEVTGAFLKSKKLINQSLTLEEAAKVHDLPSSQADESQKSDDAEPLNALVGRFYIKGPSKWKLSLVKLHI
jgi:hypothetical protein